MIYNNFDSFPWETEERDENGLMQYLQQQNPETLERIARSVSPEIKEIITHNVKGLVGMLPSEDFAIQITTDRENMANLLASAMMTGYFLGQVEKRHNLESTLLGTDSIRFSPKPPLD
jgi:5,10-methenyltetrahydromethanopterin hydrogenase